MNLFEAIILGIVQGFSEFLPISSSGHLVLVQKLLGVPEPSLLMTVLLHVGTLVPVIVIFWRDWWEMLKNPFKSNVFWMLVLATLPAVAAALLFEEQINALFGSGWFLGYEFLITAALLLLGERVVARRPVKRGRHSRSEDVDSVTTLQAGVMGVMQAVAIMPAISRSGSTIVGGLFTGLNRQTAAKFSFMMSAPAILGSLLFELKDLFGAETPVFAQGILAPLVGILVAAVCGYVAIRWMLRLLQKTPLTVFAAYVAVIGVLVLVDQYITHLVF